MEKLVIELVLIGYKLKPDDFEVKAINNEILEIKADTEVKKINLDESSLCPRMFKIECKFQIKEDILQEITINCPKQVKVTSIPTFVAAYSRGVTGGD